VVSSKPRPLTNKDIEYIESKVLKLSGLTGYIEETRNKEFREWLRRNLLGKPLTPDGIDDLVDTINMRTRRARIDPGTPLGLNVSESIGSTTTQMTLNTFKVIGHSLAAASGITALRELIYASPKRKGVETHIYFKKRLSFVEAFRMRSSMVQVNVSDLIYDYNIINLDNFEEDSWYEPYLRLSGYKGKKKKLPEDSEAVLRLIFDQYKLFAYNVTLSEIVFTIENSNSSPLVCVQSPTRLGIVDVYPLDIMEGKEADRKYISSYYEQVTFLKDFIYGNLDKFKIKGITGIKFMAPVVLPLLSCISSESQVAEGIYKLQFNIPMMKERGITEDDFRKLFQIANKDIRKVKRFNGNLSSVTIESDNGKSVLESLQNRYEKEITKSLEERDKSKFLRAAQLIIVQTDGSNLIEVLNHPKVDPTRVFCTDIHEMVRVFGIDIAKVIYMRELRKILMKSNTYFNPRLITFITDYSFGTGTLTGLTFAGIKKRVGVLSAATIQQSLNVITSGALTGRSERTTSVSSSISVGGAPQVGTGSFGVVNDPKKATQELNDYWNGVTKKKINVSNSDLENLESLENIGTNIGTGAPGNYVSFAHTETEANIQQTITERREEKERRVSKEKMKKNKTNPGLPKTDDNSRSSIISEGTSDLLNTIRFNTKKREPISIVKKKEKREKKKFDLKITPVSPKVSEKVKIVGEEGKEEEEEEEMELEIEEPEYREINAEEMMSILK
jgi:hypothetical protein